MASHFHISTWTKWCDINVSNQDNLVCCANVEQINLVQETHTAVTLTK